MKKFLALLCLCMMLTSCTAETLPETETAEDTETKANETAAPLEETTKEETTEAVDVGPKKYFTLSFDDGITQDIKIIEILKKYGMDSCTFFINTGLYGANWTWVGEQFSRPDVTHKRFTRKELLTGIYDGFDLSGHTLSHTSLKNYDSNPDMIVREVEQDLTNIEKISGIRPVGFSWPGGDTEYTEKTIEIVRERTGARFARAANPTYGFDLPEYFLKWHPTCSISDGNCLTLAREFINAECTEDMLFYVWGHGYELDLYNSYDKFEALIRLIANADDIVCVTNTEFYELFKDDIPSWKTDTEE